MNNFIVVGACNTLVSQVLLAIRSFSDRKCVVIGGANTRGLRRSALCSEHEEISFDEPDENHFTELVNAHSVRMAHAVMIPVDCAAVRLVNRVHKQLQVKSIPIPGTPTLDMFDDKWHFFRFCKEQGLTVPDTVYIGAKENLDYDQVSARLGEPFIIKPVNQAGSEGVQVIRNRMHYEEAVMRNGAYAFDALIAQKYIDGIDVCIDLLAVRGKVRALAFQRRIGSQIVFFNNAHMESIAHRLARSSKYNGVMNLDARIEEETGKVYLLESNPRFWASLTASVGCGLNFVCESIWPEHYANPARKLIFGTYHMRHPAVHPSSWMSLLFDASPHGRLLRAKMTDLQGLGGVAKSLAAKPWNQLPELLSRRRTEDQYHIQQR